MTVRAHFAAPLFCFALLLLLALPVGAQTAQQTCWDKKASADATITSCTQAIASGAATGHALADLYYDRGIGYYDEGQYDLAIADFNQALSIVPDYAIVYNNRGISYRQKGQDDLALADYTHALQIDPKLREAFSNRGLLYSSRKQYDLAIADFSQALRIDPNYSVDYERRCAAYAAKGQHDLAKADCNRAALGASSPSLPSAADAPHRAMVALFGVASWRGSDCHVGKENRHGQTVAAGGCTDAELEGANWWMFTGPDGPQTLSFEVRDDGTVKASGMAVWAGCGGDVVGVPRNTEFSEIRWEVRPTDAPPRIIYSYAPANGSSLTLSCTRPLSGADARTKYRYVQFIRL